MLGKATKLKISNTFQDRRGQSLVEVMITIFIVVVGLAAVLSLLVFSLTAVRDSENRVIAANFAREGIDVVRNIRDTNWLKGCPEPDNPDDCFYWNTGLSSEGDYTAIAIFNPGAGSWSLDFIPNEIVIGDSSTRLYRGSDNLAVQALTPPEGFTATNYYRLLTLDPINDVNGDQVGIDAKAQVKWIDHGEHSLVVEEKMYNWR